MDMNMTMTNMTNFTNITDSLSNVSNVTNMTACWLGGADGEVDEVSSGLVAIGTALTTLGSFVSCFGMNLQKWAHKVEEETTPEERKGMLKNWRWWAGITCLILGSVMDTTALKFVPMSRVAALGGVTIVANMVITPRFLDEKLTKHDYIGCGFIIVGVTMACYFGAGEEKELSSSCLLELFEEGMFLTYFCIALVVLAVLFYFMEGFRRVSKHFTAAGYIGGEGAPQFLSTPWLHENLDKLEEIQAAHPSRFMFITRFGPQFYPAVHAFFAGGIGAQSVMFAKAVVIFFGNTVEGEDTMRSVGYLVAFLLPTLFCLLNQVKFLNTALQIYPEAVFVLPIYQAVWITAGVGGGLVLYKEYEYISDANFVLFWLGILVGVAGLGVLACRTSAAGTESATPTPVNEPINEELPDMHAIVIDGQAPNAAGNNAKTPSTQPANPEGEEVKENAPKNACA